jgi:hypothetical protein
MKDPHFLLYLSLYLDESAMGMLCKYIICDKPTSRVSAKLAMSLDMLKMSFADIDSDEAEE